MNRHRATHTSIMDSNEVDVAAIKSIDQKASTGIIVPRDLQYERRTRFSTSSSVNSIAKTDCTENSIEMTIAMHRKNLEFICFSESKTGQI